MPLPQVCEFHLRGECRYGVQCWNSHQDPQTRSTGGLSTVDDQVQAMMNTSIRLMERQLAKRRAKEAARAFSEAYQRDGRWDALLALLSYPNDRETPDQHTITAPTNTLSAQLEVHDHYTSPAQSTSTTSTNASIAQIRVQNLCARPSQSTSTSTNSTNASIANLIQEQDLCARPSQSTSTSTDSTDALIACIKREQDRCARPSQSTSTSTNSTNALTAQAQELQLPLEACMRPILKQPDNSKIAMEMVANNLSVAMDTGNGNSEKETASNFHALHQKKMKESNENHGSVWDDILLSAIDSDLVCNICFEIFIKPTVLNCTHTFCESCINVWTARNIACPICRVKVKSKSYCLTLESFIKKIVEHLPKEIKDKREAEIKDRSDVTSNRRIYRPNLSESVLFRVNIHDTLVSTGGVNPLMSYVGGTEEQTSSRRITRPYNSSTRH